MRGRKPTPTHLKLVRGNPGKRPLNKAEPQGGAELFEPPEWLTAAQKAGWSYVIAHAPAGLLRKLDRGLLAAWVVAEDLHRQAAQQVAQHGTIVKAPSGLPVQSPFLPIVNRQATIMTRIAVELGFSPVSRARISLPAPPAPDPSGEFFGA